MWKDNRLYTIEIDEMDWTAHFPDLATYYREHRETTLEEISFARNLRSRVLFEMHMLFDNETLNPSELGLYIFRNYSVLITSLALQKSGPAHYFYERKHVKNDTANLISLVLAQEVLIGLQKIKSGEIKV